MKEKPKVVMPNNSDEKRNEDSDGKAKATKPQAKRKKGPVPIRNAS